MINFYDSYSLDTPNDVPEGRSVVIVSTTLFYEWVTSHGLTIEEWGTPQAKDGVLVYSPTVTKPDG